MKPINTSKVREVELDCIVEIITTLLEKDLTQLKVLEIGSGTGIQAKMLTDLGCDVIAIDIHDSNYSKDRVFDIVDYNGKDIPFPDDYFDIVFSSNVLEHISNIDDFHCEMQRVVRASGYSIHVLPSGVWRFWTNFTYYLNFIYRVVSNEFFNGGKSYKSEVINNYKNRSKRSICQKCLPARHGEKGNFLTEIYYFSKYYWVRSFIKARWNIVHISKNKLFYTGHALFGRSINTVVRRNISRLLGSSCNIFVLQKSRPNRTPVRVK